MQAIELPRVCYLIVGPRLISIRISLRPASRDEMGVEIMASVFGCPGAASGLSMRVVLLELNNYMPLLASISGFDNFPNTPLTEIVQVVDAVWKRAGFRARASRATRRPHRRLAHSARRNGAFGSQINLLRITKHTRS